MSSFCLDCGEIFSKRFLARNHPWVRNYCDYCAAAGLGLVEE